jgi:hypothetical protein
MKYLYIIITFILFFSCEKDNITSSDSNNDCIEIPPSQSMLGYDYTNDTNSIAFPCFNPNNGNEILFVHQRYSNSSHKLYKYNLITHNKELILTSEIYFQPDWGINNWILLGLNNNIFKIKTNGDSLIQLSFDGGIYKPVFNSISELYICSNTDKREFYVCNMDGYCVDTIKDVYITSPFDWNNENNISLPTNEGVYIYNYSNSNTSLLCEEFSGPYISRAKWINNNEFVFANKEGIYKTNIVTNLTIMINYFCNAWSYSSPDYSNELNKLIWQKVKKKKIGENLIEVKSVLVLMDTDGTNEQEIEIK